MVESCTESSVHTTNSVRVNLVSFLILRVGNVVLNDCYERYYLDLEYAEEHRGLYLVRGENIVLIAELV